MPEDRRDDSDPEPTIGGEDDADARDAGDSRDEEADARTPTRDAASDSASDPDRAGEHGHGHGHDLDHGDAPDHDDHRDHEEPTAGRLTSPMQPYGAREVGIGFVITLVGIAVGYALPLLLG
jgi:hypothetical protein